MEFTITVRPLRWIKNMVMVTALIPLLGFPTTMSVAAHDVAAVPTIVRVDPKIELIAQIESELLAGMTKASVIEIHQVAVTIVEECEQAKFDPFFILAIIAAESNFDIEAVSPTGARGLMQVIPATFRSVSDAKRMFDPVENVRAGIRYLAKISREYKFKDPETYLFAYNQGPGAVVDHYRNGVPMPDEAVSYIPAVIGKYQKVLERFDRNPKQYRKLFRV
jgi:hypothetical protein